MEIIYRHELTTIQYSRTYSLLQVVWDGYVTSDEYRKIMKEMLRFTKEFQIVGWIFDMTKAEKLQIGDVNWTTDYLSPILTGTTLKKVARVDTNNPEYTNQVKELVANAAQKYNVTIDMQYFNNLDDAFTWMVGRKVNFTTEWA